jgi:surface protein
MFNDCIALEYLDLSDFDTQNATNFAQFFEGCQSLITIVGMDKWDTSNVETMYEMFNYNGKNMQLQYVDLSSFDTSKLTSTYAMFNGCKNLTTIYVGDDWDMSNVTSSGAMFSSCPKLVGGNGTIYNGSITNADYAHVDTAENPGYLTHISDKP